MKGNDIFYRYHPTVNALYFALILGFSMVLRHPVFQLISLLSGMIYCILCEGRRGVLFSLKYVLPLILITALINPAFNHEGVTILCYLPLGNPLTLESILYGVSAGVMFASVLLWFRSLNRVFSTDKFVYLFGKVMPALSLLLSMTLRFIPRFHAQTEMVKEAQKCLGTDTENGSVFKRLRNSFRVFSIVVTWSLENSIETSDSMKSRGYGTGRRTAYSIYRFEERDRNALIFIVFCGCIVFSGALAGGTAFRFYPSIRIAIFSPINIVLQLAYLALCLFPVVLNRKESAKWSAMR